MQFDRFIADYLQQHQQVSIHGMGILQFHGQDTKADSSTHGSAPSPALVFTWHQNAETSSGFMDYLIASIKKPATIVQADWEEYLLQIKSSINSGKDVLIQGIGTFKKKLPSGEIVFVQGQPVREKLSYESFDASSFGISSNVKPAPNRKKALTIVGFIIVVFVLGAIALLVYRSQKGVNLFSKKSVTSKDTVPKQDTPRVQPVVPANPAPVDSSTLAVNDTVRYRVVFLATKYKEKAMKRLKEFIPADKIQYDSLMINDTMRHRLFIYKKAVPKDTTSTKLFFEEYFKHAIMLEVAN